MGCVADLVRPLAHDERPCHHACTCSSWRMSLPRMSEKKPKPEAVSSGSVMKIEMKGNTRVRGLSGVRFAGEHAFSILLPGDSLSLHHEKRATVPATDAAYTVRQLVRGRRRTSAAFFAKAARSARPTSNRLSTQGRRECVEGPTQRVQHSQVPASRRRSDRLETRRRTHFRRTSSSTGRIGFSGVATLAPRHHTRQPGRVSCYIVQLRADRL